jgi:quinol monooxygenase YgiN
MNEITKPATTDAAQRKIVHITAKPGSGDAMRAALLALEAPTRLEEGCSGFTFFQSLSAPEHFLLIEEFASAAALALHMQLPHTQAFFARDLVAGIAPVAKDWLA